VLGVVVAEALGEGVEVLSDMSTLMSIACISTGFMLIQTSRIDVATGREAQ